MIVKNPVAFLCVALLLVPGTLSAAQTLTRVNVSGEVLDASTYRPVSGAEVEMANRGYVAESDARGRFRILATEGNSEIGFSVRSASAIEFSGAKRELKLTLETAGPIELTLFDVRGKSTLLHRGEHGAGEYTFALDAMLETPLPAGLFFLRVKTAEFTETLRLAGTGDVARSTAIPKSVRYGAKAGEPVDTLVLEKAGY